MGNRLVKKIFLLLILPLVLLSFFAFEKTYEIDSIKYYAEVVEEENQGNGEAKNIVEIFKENNLSSQALNQYFLQYIKSNSTFNEETDKEVVITNPEIFDELTSFGLHSFRVEYQINPLDEEESPRSNYFYGTLKLYKETIVRGKAVISPENQNVIEGQNIEEINIETNTNHENAYNDEVYAYFIYDTVLNRELDSPEGLSINLIPSSENYKISGSPSLSDWGGTEEQRRVNLFTKITFKYGGEQYLSSSLLIYRDTDRDGTPDYRDNDDDGDGITDEVEIEHGTDPKDPNSFPTMAQLYKDDIITNKLKVYLGNPAPLNEAVVMKDIYKRVTIHTPVDTNAMGAQSGYVSVTFTDNSKALARVDVDVYKIQYVKGNVLVNVDNQTVVEGLSVEDVVITEEEPELTTANYVEERKATIKSYRIQNLPRGVTLSNNRISGIPALNDWGATEEERRHRVFVNVIYEENVQPSPLEIIINVQRDTDRDGVPDITDEDDDGDGVSDVLERKFNTDPKDPNSKPTAAQLEDQSVIVKEIRTYVESEINLLDAVYTEIAGFNKEIVEDVDTYFPGIYQGKVKGTFPDSSTKVYTVTVKVYDYNYLPQRVSFKNNNVDVVEGQRIEDILVFKESPILKGANDETLTIDKEDTLISEEFINLYSLTGGEDKISGVININNWSRKEEVRELTIKLEQEYEHVGIQQSSVTFNVLRDTDGDGVPDIYDLDDDGDGISDEVEIANGTNPKDPNSKPPLAIIDETDLRLVELEAFVNENIDITKAITNQPKDTVLSVKRAADTSSVGEKSGIVEVKYKDNSAKDVFVTVKVYNKAYMDPEISVGPKNQRVTERNSIIPIEVSVKNKKSYVNEETWTKYVGYDSYTSKPGATLPSNLTYNNNKISGVPVVDWEAKEEINKELTVNYELRFTYDDQSTKDVSFSSNITVDRDRDLDGIPDYRDNDIDGDGYSNDEEIAAGTDPYDPTSRPDTSNIILIPSTQTVIEGNPIVPIEYQVPDWTDNVGFSNPNSFFEIDYINQNISGTITVDDWGKTEERREYQIILYARSFDGAITSNTAKVIFLRDTDGDGVPDIEDLDDDGDGVPDDVEIEHGTDPKDPDSKPSAAELDDTVINKKVLKTEVGKAIDERAGIVNKPDGSTLTVVESADVSTKGEKTAKVKITYPDGSSKTEDVKVRVYEVVYKKGTLSVTPKEQNVIEGNPITNIIYTEETPSEGGYDEKNFILYKKDKVTSDTYTTELYGLTKSENKLSGNITYTFTGQEEVKDITITRKVVYENLGSETVSTKIKYLRDTDKDGIPDITDTDDDGDGVPDEVEIEHGNDPKDPDDRPSDADLDKTPINKKDFEVEVGATVDIKEGILNQPENTTLETTVDVDTSTKGEKTGKVKIIYPDNSYKEVEIKVKVYEVEYLVPTITANPNNQRVVESSNINPITFSESKVNETYDQENFIKFKKDTLVSKNYSLLNGLNNSKDVISGKVNVTWASKTEILKEVEVKRVDKYAHHDDIVTISKITIDRDRDNDGVPDKDDPDIDGDGYSNEEEEEAGTDPYDPNSKPDAPNMTITPEYQEVIEGKNISTITYTIPSWAQNVQADLPSGLSIDKNTKKITGKVKINNWGKTEEERIVKVKLSSTNKEGLKTEVEARIKVYRDTDGDGTPDYLDEDDDGDGVPDDVEIEHGTDPKDPEDKPSDADLDNSPINKKDLETDINVPVDIKTGLIEKPDNTTLRVKKDVDVSTKGEKTGIVEIVYKDGSTKEVEIKVKVYEIKYLMHKLAVNPTNQEVIENKNIKNITFTDSIEEERKDTVNLIKYKHGTVISDSFSNKYGLSENNKVLSGKVNYKFRGQEEIKNITIRRTVKYAHGESKYVSTKIRYLRDTDGDGVPDITDPDDDGDGYTDEEEKEAGTDPKDPSSNPKEKKKKNLEDKLKEYQDLINDTNEDPFEDKKKDQVDKLKEDLKDDQKFHDKVKENIDNYNDDEIDQKIDEVQDKIDKIKEKINNLEDKANIDKLKEEVERKEDTDGYTEESVKDLMDAKDNGKDGLDRKDTINQDEVDDLTQDIIDKRNNLVPDKTELVEKIEELEKQIDENECTAKECSEVLEEAKQVNEDEDATRDEIREMIKKINDVLGKKYEEVVNPPTSVKSFIFIILLIATLSYVGLRYKKRYL